MKRSNYDKNLESTRIDLINSNPSSSLYFKEYFSKLPDSHTIQNMEFIDKKFDEIYQNEEDHNESQLNLRRFKILTLYYYMY